MSREESHAARPGDEGEHAPPRRAMELLVLDVAAAREVDRLATSEFGLPSLVLMENAARELAEVVFDTLAVMNEHTRRGGVLIVCGTGNNGGDGLALLRILDNAHVNAVAVCVGASRSGSDAAVQRGICQRAGLRMVECADGNIDAACRTGLVDAAPAVVVDCLLGTGLSREPDAACTRAIAAMNTIGSRGSQVIAADVPSGLDAQSGVVLGAAVRAGATVTFAAVKPGLLTLEAQEYVGELIIADIGVPRRLVERLGRKVCIAAYGDDEHDVA